MFCVNRENERLDALEEKIPVQMVPRKEKWKKFCSKNYKKRKHEKRSKYPRRKKKNKY